MDYQKTASEILKHIGGEKNVVSLEHCSTRLRFILADRSKADADAVKKIPGGLMIVPLLLGGAG